MTVPTGRAVAAAVDVVHCMATDALGGRTVINVAAMAVHAFDGSMPAGEAIADCFVIESGIGPAPFVVTVLAFDPERAAVHVVVHVAACAIRRSGAMFFVRRVTAAACHAQVRRQQREVTESVIEYTGIHGHDVGAASLVIGMTDDTFASLRRREDAVETRTVSPVLADLLMAFNAQISLRKLRLPVVTGGAIALDVGMALDDPAWHDQFFQTRHLRFGPRREQQ